MEDNYTVVRKIKQQKLRRKARRGEIAMRRLYKLFRFIIIIIIFYGIYRISLAHYWYFPKDLYTKNTDKYIEILGNNIVPKSKIINEIKKIPIEKKPIYMINPTEAAKALEKLSPVKSAYVRRFWFPARYVIMLEEETPAIVIAPKEDVSLREKNYIKIGENKFIRALYVSRLPKSVTPRFYNRITTIENANIITTLNITPTDPAKVIQKVNKKISGMKTERLEKIKKANKNNYSYEAVKDEKLEDSIRDAQALRDALQKKKQKLFTNNVVICIQANTLDELNKVTKQIKDIGNEHMISIYNLDWQQLEGLQNCLAFGWNNLQMQRSLTSESTAANVPFNTKDLMHPNSIFHGINLVSKNPVFCDRKKLLNGNGCVLATSGAGKSFSIKIIIEQVLLRYPQDEVIVIDPQRRI